MMQEPIINKSDFLVYNIENSKNVMKEFFIRQKTSITLESEYYNVTGLFWNINKGGPLIKVTCTIINIKLLLNNDSNHSINILKLTKIYKTLYSYITSLFIA